MKSIYAKNKYSARGGCVLLLLLLGGGNAFGFAEKDSLYRDSVYIEFKIAEMLGVGTEAVCSNMKLYEFVNKWLGTPYRYGRQSESAVDCSGLTRELYGTVYGIDLPRSSAEIGSIGHAVTVSPEQGLMEGDLLFFHTTSKTRITHVAIYLLNGMMLTANTHGGVQINSMKNKYWASRFAFATRNAAFIAASSNTEIQVYDEKF